MAHRTQYSKDIDLPRHIEQYRRALQKQIQKVKERQKQLIDQNNQKLHVLEKRIIYGKRKIFIFDKQVNRMTLSDQITHHNMQIQKLKAQIAQQQDLIHRNNEQQKEKDKQELLTETGMQTSPNKRMSMQSSKSKQKIRNQLISDPQEQLIALTHEIIRLKKSLQGVRSKYSQNFTEQRLKQEYGKLKQENQLIALELKQFQKIQKIVDEAVNTRNASDVDYDELEVIMARKQFELVRRERDLLNEYLGKIEVEEKEKKHSDQRRMQRFRQEKINRLQMQIEQVTKQNQILQSQIQLTQKQIQRCLDYQKQLKGRP